jgi:Putative nucleotidyltransferase substrate binding domain
MTFLARVAGRALERRPPLGFIGRFLVERRGPRPGTFDLKTRGVAPIVDGARLMALAHGLRATNTVERLTGAAHSGMLAEDDARDLRAAFEALQELRPRHQSARTVAGERADNCLIPERCRAVRLPRCASTSRRCSICKARSTCATRLNSEARKTQLTRRAWWFPRSRRDSWRDSTVPGPATGIEEVVPSRGLTAGRARRSNTRYSA